jgi:DNA-binding NarL/FixJ family response regulator
MMPFSLLIFESNPGFLRLLVQHVEANHGKTLSIVGAVFREADALALAQATCPQIVLLGMYGPVQKSYQLIDALRSRLP